MSKFSVFLQGMFAAEYIYRVKNDSENPPRHQSALHETVLDLPFVHDKPKKRSFEAARFDYKVYLEKVQ